MKHFTDPVRLLLIMDIHELGHTTTKVLLERNPQIPQATLYRYIKSFLNVGIIKVAEERKVRSVTEKTYEMAIDLNNLASDTVEKNDGKTYFLFFQQFVAGLSKEFQEYSEREEIHLINDASGFRVTPFYATADEVREMGERIGEVVAEYAKNGASPDRKLRSFARVITPPKEERGNAK